MRKFIFFFTLLLSSSYLHGEIVTSEGIFKHIGNISQNKACLLAEERAKNGAIKKKQHVKNPIFGQF